MDWQGQKLAEHLMQYLLVGSALIAFLTGYLMSAYRLMLLIYLAGIAIAFLLTVPDWPCFNRHPLKWAENSSTDGSGARQLMLKQQHQATKKSGKTGTKR